MIATGRGRPGLWAACGVALAGLMVAVAIWAWRDTSENGWLLNKAVPLTLFFVAAAVYFLAVWLCPKATLRRGQWVLIILVAMVMRLSLWSVPAGFDSDVNRYMWDGAVTAAGVSPYRYAPQEIADGNVADPAVQALAERGKDVLNSVNHPQLRTIYPPAAQGAFAVAHWLTPFQVTGWRCVLLLADVATAILLVMLLRGASLPLSWLTIYAWNPLLVVETYYSSHLDLLLAPLLLLLVWALVNRRPVAAGVALTAAAGVKLWPILLLGFLVGRFRGQRRQLIAALVTVAALTVAGAAIFAAAARGENSGVVAYSAHWQGAEGAYAALRWVGCRIGYTLALPVGPDMIGRWILMGVLVAVFGWLGLRRFDSARELCGRMGLAILVMLLLSPVVWPWYFLAVIPLAAIARRPSLLVWTALLPLVYVVRSAGDSQLSVAIHAPVWILLAGETFIAMRRRRKEVRARNV